MKISQGVDIAPDFRGCRLKGAGHDDPDPENLVKDAQDSQMEDARGGQGKRPTPLEKGGQDGDRGGDQGHVGDQGHKHDGDEEDQSRDALPEKKTAFQRRKGSQGEDMS